MLVPLFCRVTWTVARHIPAGSSKTVHPGKIVCTFGLGSKATYGAIHDNPDISCQPVDKTNLPHLIIQNDRLMSMISLAHPDFRDDLEREARTNGLIPRSFA